jgi:hypothetical protein
VRGSRHQVHVGIAAGRPRDRLRVHRPLLPRGLVDQPERIAAPREPPQHRAGIVAGALPAARGALQEQHRPVAGEDLRHARKRPRLGALDVHLHEVHAADPQRGQRAVQRHGGHRHPPAELLGSEQRVLALVVGMPVEGLRPRPVGHGLRAHDGAGAERRQVGGEQRAVGGIGLERDHPAIGGRAAQRDHGVVAEVGAHVHHRHARGQPAAEARAHLPLVDAERERARHDRVVGVEGERPLRQLHAEGQEAPEGRIGGGTQGTGPQHPRVEPFRRVAGEPAQRPSQRGAERAR